MFVLSKPFQPIQMCAGKAGAYPSKAPFWLVALPTNIRVDWKGLPGKSTLAYH